VWRWNHGWQLTMSLVASQPNVSKKHVDVSSVLKRVARVMTKPSMVHNSAALAQKLCTRAGCVTYRILLYPSNAQTAASAATPPRQANKFPSSMSDSPPPQFPSGIPDPPIFKRLGPKDRSHLRHNIETQHFDTMSTEQTYVRADAMPSHSCNWRCG
jgi:hypothetical protein